MSNILAIVGRPNVGKSTLFNRLVQDRKAIIHESSGVTRDRHYGTSDWTGVEFTVIDTGGYVEHGQDVFEVEISKQVLLAINEADVIIFLVDVISGITDIDLEVANILRRQKKKVIVVANKVDYSDRIYESHLFYGLGLGEVFCISAASGSGTGDVLDEVIKHFPKDEPVGDDEVVEIPRIAIVGRPNVGKSSLLNALVGEERNIVTPIAGTTRDSIDTHYQKYGHDFILIDTAGLRKKSAEMEDLEFYSVLRSIRAIETADVCLLLIDAERGIESQDINIFRLIVKNHKGVAILVNKWDLVEKDTKSTDEFTKKIHEKIAPFIDVPIIFVSALTKQRILKALEVALDVNENRRRRITTSKLNEVMLPIIDQFQPPAVKGKYIKIKLVQQLPTHAPSFIFFCNLPQYVTEAYKRFLENQLRKNFNFTGVPILVFMRKK